MFLLLLASSLGAQVQGNGRLQLHFMHVDQGDAALLISPRGETILFDNGVRNFCYLPLSYLDQLGVQSIDYHVASHYHDDHIGCSAEVFTVHPIRRAAYDRGQTYTTQTYNRYIQSIGSLRQTVTPGSSIVLDQGSTSPVTITFYALNGRTANTQAPTNNENDRSVVAVVRFGQFDAVFGGDLSGATTGTYRDVETSVGPVVGPVELYKVNHHGSGFSSNSAWLTAIAPRIAIISAGRNNEHGHPTAGAMQRLHQANVRTYWTSVGSGTVQPVNGQDVVSGNTIVEVPPGSQTFTVRYGNGTIDTHRMIGVGDDATAPAAFAWSSKSGIYHHAQCRYVENILPENLARGNTPPAGKTLHANCPQ